MPQDKSPAIKLAANALTTVERVKSLLGGDGAVGDDYDAPLILLINAASAWVETQVGRKLGRSLYTERHSGSGSQELVLQQWPITAVEYVKDITSGTEVPPEKYDFIMSGNIGSLYKDDGWTYRGYRGGLAGDLVAPTRYLEVKYTAGYILPWEATEETPVTLPADIESVVWGIVEQEYSIRQNGAQGLKAFSISDISWTFDKEPRESWVDTITRYKRW